MFTTRRFIALFILVGLLTLAACASPTPEPTKAPPPPAATSVPAATSAPAATSVPVATKAPEPATAKPPAPTATSRPISLRMAILVDEGTLNPYTYVLGYPGWNMLNLVYDTLLVLDADSVPKPWVAKEYKISPDGKVYTLTLRDNVKWHDGKALTSADVKFSFEYYKKNARGRFTTPVRDIVSMDTPNETTVVITLPAPNPSFIYEPLADAPIMPKHVWENEADPKKVTNATGSGPFKLAEYKSEQFYRFTANATYFAGKPAVDELLMPIIKDPTTVFASLKTGEIQGTTRELSPELVKDFSSAADMKVQRGPGFATTMLLFNSERAPWDKKEVRQAVGLAIDTQKLVDTILLGFGTAGNPGWLHPQSAFHDPGVKAEVNVAKAKSLLDGLGYKDSNNDGIREAAGKNIEGALLVYSNNPQRIRAAELIAAAVKEIGISFKVTALEVNSLDAKVWPDFDVAKGRDFDVSMWGWSAPVQVNPVRMVQLVHSDPRVGNSNVGGYKNPAVDKLGDDLRVTTDPEKQKTLVRQMEALIAQEMPFVLLYYADGNYVYRTAAYDKWVYQKGQGIFNKLSFLPGVKP
ncbi:Oligopeptide-binding protein AppA [Gammaproteobacteria bacterium]|nr:Oligopeptide-binding protein AppA [Gammaproteobacteria bacterium]